MKPFVINCRTAKAHAMLDIERLDGEICLDGVTLRRIPYHRLGDVQQELRENYGEFGNWLAQYEAIKEFDCHVRTDMDFEVCSREVHRQFQELLAALRLLRLGGIDFTGLVVKPLSYDDSRVKFKGEFFDPQPRIGGLPDYRLSPADVPKIEELLSLVKKRKLVDQFFFRRFMRSYHQTPEDRIVDSTICLESLLCPKNARKVSYRFRKCGAAILANEASDRQQLFQELGVVYDLRSKIVHGAFSEKSKDTRKRLKSLGEETLRDAGRKCLDFARRLILKWLREPAVFKENELDTLLLGGSGDVNQS